MGGYRYKWQEAAALVDQGMDAEGVAAAMGCSVRAAQALIDYGDRRRADQRAAVQSADERRVFERAFYRKTPTTDRLRAEAKKRGMMLPQLIDTVIARVVDDDLFVAVLDD